MPYICMAFHSSFNTQPPEGGWVLQVAGQERRIVVSTHSRPKAAGQCYSQHQAWWYCFNTQPPEGGWDFYPIIPLRRGVSTHSRPKAAGKLYKLQ